MDIRFSNRLKELRQNRDVMQLELAKTLNVHKTTISNWENGKRFPDEDMLNKIAEYFNVSMNYLLGKDEIIEGESISNAIKRRVYLEMTDDGKIINSIAAQLIQRLIDEKIISEDGSIDENTLTLIKEAIKIDAKLSNNIKKGAK